MFTNQDLKKLIIPLFLEQLLVALVGIADVFVIGFVGEAAVSGVSLVNAFNMIFINLFTALASGGAVVISQYIGKKDKEQAYHHGVVQVRFRCIDGKGKAAGVCERMVLGPRLAPVSGIRAGFFPLPRPRGGRLSQQGRGANQSRRPCQAGRAAPCGDDPRRRPAANRGAAASRSCPSRSPSPAADPPRGFRS